MGKFKTLTLKTITAYALWLMVTTILHCSLLFLALQMQSTACFYSARMFKVIAFAQEACAADTSAAFKAAQGKLARYTRALEHLHYTLTLGDDAVRITGVILL